MTVVYVDLLFFLNLTANYLLLLGTGRIGGMPLKRIRIALGAGMGAVYAVMVFLPNAGWLSSILCRGAVGILMVLAAYGAGAGLVRLTLLFYAVSAALAGLVLGAEQLGRTSLTLKHGVFYSPVDMRLLLLLFALCYFILSVFFRRIGRHVGRDLVELDIRLQGEKMTLVALKDSGHTLLDPVTNQTVVIAYFKCLPSYLLNYIDPSDPITSMKRCREQGIKGVQLIPYRAVGIDCGLLLAIKADSVLVGGKQMGKLLIAMSPNPVDDGGGFQALIGGDG